VFIVDFSYKRPVMLNLLESAHAVTVLDHHKSAEAELAGLADEFAEWPAGQEPEITFDMHKSGARLAWEYLYGNQLLPGRWMDTDSTGLSLESPPWLVRYTEDRDLWLWKLPHSREINAALRSYALTFETWDSLAERGPSEFVAEGEAILRAEQQTVAAHVRHAREVALGGHVVLAVNATTLQSEIAGELAAGRPFGVCYLDTGDGVRRYSLRSREGGIDVSEIAKQYGGGGHVRAAGFERKVPAAV
jgi:oligoribonuclease NrnB/cAMP/cGMP phosphodiesterase (DHH superfamily)